MTVLIELVALLIAAVVLMDLFIGFKITKSIFNRFRMKADLMAEEIRDPIAEAHSAIENIKSKKNDAVTLRKSLLQKIESLKLRKKKEESNVVNFEKLAKLAGKAQNADDVKTALTSKKSSENRVASMDKELDALQKQEDELETLIKNCDNLIQDAENKKDVLKSSIETNRFREQVASVLKDNSGDAMSAIQRLELDALQAEASANAAEGLAGENVSLSQKYNTSSVEVADDDIAQYLKS